MSDYLRVSTLTLEVIEMKINQLKIEGFGKIINQTYNLSDMTTFLGDNETGKSTILAFIKYMLFGFENATTANQNFNPLDVKTYGGQITLTHENKTIKIERIKILRTGKPSFSCEISEEGQSYQLDEASWQEFMRPITAKVFSEIYTVTQDNLQISTVKDYNADRLDQEWRMSATTGTVALFDQVQKLSKSRDQIFTTTRAAKKPINQALTDIASVQEAIEKKTTEEAALLPLMTKNAELEEQIKDYRDQQTSLDDLINQSKHKLSFLAEYQEYQELDSQNLSNILSTEEADNLRRKHALHEKYNQEIRNLNQKIAADSIAIENLDTPKNRFLQDEETLEKFYQLKLEYPKAISAEQQIAQFKFSKHYLIITIIAIILMGISLALKPFVAIFFLIIAIVSGISHYKTHQLERQELAKNEAVLADFDQKVAYFNDMIVLDNDSVNTKIENITLLEKELQGLRITLSQYHPKESIEKLSALKDLDNAIFEEIPDIDTAPKLLEQWAQQSRDLMRLTRLKEQLSKIFDLSIVFNGYKEQKQLDQQVAEKTKITQELNSVIDEHSRNLAVINQQKTDTTLIDLAAKLARKKATLRDYLVDFATKTAEIKLIGDVMQSLSSETLPDILHRASLLFRELTNNSWQEIYLDEDILWVKNSRKQSLRLIDLSTGTRDQLQLALRLAFIQSKKQEFPIFLDDNFLRFDKTRRLNFGKLLQTIAQDRQIILLTSDQDFTLEMEGTIKL